MTDSPAAVAAPGGKRDGRVEVEHPLHLVDEPLVGRLRSRFGPPRIIWRPDRKTFLAFWPRNVLIGLLLILMYLYIESFLGRRNSFWGPNPKDGHGLPRGAVGTGHLKQNFGVPGHPQVGCDEAVEAEVVEAVPPARTLISLGALTSVKNGRE